MKTASWVIVEISTGKAVYETFSAVHAAIVNTKKYKAVPIMVYLTELNASLKVLHSGVKVL